MRLDADNHTVVEERDAFQEQAKRLEDANETTDDHDVLLTQLKMMEDQLKLHILRTAGTLHRDRNKD